MKIRLDLIKPSPRPVRSSWDEGKMQELTQSIQEQGLIVPIKVRPDSELKLCPMHGTSSLVEESMDEVDARGDCGLCYDLGKQVWLELDHKDGWLDVDYGGPPTGIIPFEIVYGHRRVEACRRAGLGEVEAIVEGMDDTDALIQALIENVLREDMSIIDEAMGYRAIIDRANWSGKQLARNLGLSDRKIHNALALLEETEATQSLLRPSKGRSTEPGITEGHVRLVRHAIGDDPQQREPILKKASQEELTIKQTEEVAKAVKATKDDAEREAILETDYADLVRTPQFVQAKAEAKRRVERRETKKRQQEPREVAQYHDALTAFQSAVTEAVAVAEYGKFSPEAARFVKRKHDRLRQSLEELERAFNVTE
jgi:ParB/RepB/Spo0J family partition protein